MILLDTDHLTVLQYPGSGNAALLRSRLDAIPSHETVGTTVVNVEEALGGWISSIKREHKVQRQVGAYRALALQLEFFRGFNIVLFDDAAATLFTTFSRNWTSARDLKIGAIAVAQSALLLTANRQHFEKIPGLRFDNWLKANSSP